MLTCTKCGVDWQLNEFYRDPSRVNGRSNWCKECYKGYANTPLGRSRASLRSAKSAARRKGHALPDIAPEELASTVVDACQVCGSVANKRRLCMDHCHISGKFRGWLCDSCNVILGRAKDNPDRLRKLAEYLENGTA